MRKRRVNTRWRRVTWIVTDFRAGTVTEEVRWVRAVEPHEMRGIVQATSDGFI